VRALRPLPRAAGMDCVSCTELGCHYLRVPGAMGGECGRIVATNRALDGASVAPCRAKERAPSTTIEEALMASPYDTWRAIPAAAKTEYSINARESSYASGQVCTIYDTGLALSVAPASARQSHHCRGRPSADTSWNGKPASDTHRRAIVR